VSEIKETLTIPRFPIIFGHVDLVASHREAAHQRIYDAGVNACFGRVYDIADVLELIASLLADPTATGLMDRQSLRLRIQNHS
jgi:hypothetical protein